MHTTPFIAIEGLEGASKSTSLSTVQQVVSRHYPTTIVREPGGTPIAEALRTILKTQTDEVISPQTELLLMTAARLQLFDNEIVPSLEKGMAVLSDRSWLSTFAYQIAGRQLSPALFITLYQQILQSKPAYDAIIYLDIPPEIGLARARHRGKLDRFELSHINFFERARKGYYAILETLPQVYIIDANQAIDDVQAQVKSTIELIMYKARPGEAKHPDFSKLPPI